jgi:hypothetical protein
MLAQKTYGVTVTVGPAAESGGQEALRAQRAERVPERMLPAYLALLASREHGSAYHQRTGEYVLAVTLAVHADEAASEQERRDCAALAAGRVRPQAEGEAVSLSFRPERLPGQGPASSSRQPPRGLSG